MLNDDTLLNVFFLYPQDINEDVAAWPAWDKARWWYKLVHVCKRWRSLILSSPVHLGLHLVCTYGTPVADMLAHSPPFPLIIDYMDWRRDASVEDEEAILLALQDRDRVNRIGLLMPATKLLKPITAMDGHLPALERLFISSSTHENMSLMLLTRLRAPHLRMVSLDNVVLPARSTLLTTTASLVELELWNMPLLACFRPSDMIIRLSSMPQLEKISIGFRSPVPTRDVESQLLHTPVRTLVTLPNLRACFIRCGSAYVEGLLARIDTPLLETLSIWFYNQLTFTVPQLSQFLGRTDTLRIGIARVEFYRDYVILTADRDEENKIYPHAFGVRISCGHVDWQVSVAAQIFGALMPALSVVERLSLTYADHDMSYEGHNEVDRTLWREVLRPFTSVKVLHMDNGLIRILPSSLQPEDGEPPLGLLPQLEELIYVNESASDAFTSFIQSRQMLGHPVTLTHVPSS